MLVLTRKIGETVVISGKIVVKVLEASSGRVRLGIEAPDDVLVLRGELAIRLDLKAEEQAATPVLVQAGDTRRE